jgi:hypothetical protein
MKRVLVLFAVLGLGMTARGGVLTQTYCYDFKDAFGDWERSGEVWVEGWRDVHDTIPVVHFVGTGSVEGTLHRSFADVEEWTLVRVLLGSWRQELGLRMGCVDGDTVSTRVWNAALRPSLPLLGCTIHRFPARGGSLTFYAPPGVDGGTIRAVSLYRMADSCMVEPGVYTHDVVVERDTVVTQGHETVCTDCYRVTYRDIALRTSILGIHLATGDSIQRPRAYAVNEWNSPLGYAGLYTEYDEFSLVIKPDTGTVSIVFRGLEDSMAYTHEQLKLFCFDDIDTSACGKTAIRPRTSGAVRGANSSGASVENLFDIQGRRITTRAPHSPRISGIYLQSSPDGRRARVIAVDGR